MGGSVKKFGKSLSNVAKNPLDPKNYADVGLRTVTGGMVGADDVMGGLGGIIGGQKVKGTKDRYTPLDPLQEKAKGMYGNMLGQNTDRMAGIASQKQEWQARAGAADQSLLAGKLVAQRGLGKSSVGLNAIINPQKQVGENIAQIRANLPQLKQDMKFNNLDRASGGINNILNTRVFTQGMQGGRTPGILPGLLGAGLGGLMAPTGGGAAGASAGYQIGNGLSGGLV